MPPDVRKAYGFPTSPGRFLRLRLSFQAGIASRIILSDSHGKAEPFRTSGGKATQAINFLGNCMNTPEQTEFGDDFADTRATLFLNRHQGQTEVFFQQIHHGHRCFDRPGA